MLTLLAVVPLVENCASLAHCGRIEAKGLVRVLVPVASDGAYMVGLLLLYGVD